MTNRPQLSNRLSIGQFRENYWLKSELMAFCSEQGLPTMGSKFDLTARIDRYLRGDDLPEPGPRTSKRGPWDSEAGLTPESRVIHYKNDQKTREFFISQVGPGFRFNAYLRGFAKHPQDGRLTYADLVNGYRESLAQPRASIEPQFQFNQFQRDFHQNNPGADRLACNAAWREVRDAPVPSTYAAYVRLRQPAPDE